MIQRTSLHVSERNWSDVEQTVAITRSVQIHMTGSNAYLDVQESLTVNQY